MHANHKRQSLSRSFATLMTLTSVFSGGGCARLYHMMHYNSVSESLHEHHKSYYHSPQTGRIIAKEHHPAACPVELPCFGYEQTRWRPWPAECVTCGPQEELIHHGTVVEHGMSTVVQPPAAVTTQHQPAPIVMPQAEPSPADSPAPLEPADVEPDLPADDLPADDLDAVDVPGDDAGAQWPQPTEPSPYYTPAAQPAVSEERVPIADLDPTPLYPTLAASEQPFFEDPIAPTVSAKTITGPSLENERAEDLVIQPPADLRQLADDPIARGSDDTSESDQPATEQIATDAKTPSSDKQLTASTENVMEPIEAPAVVEQEVDRPIVDMKPTTISPEEAALSPVSEDDSVLSLKDADPNAAMVDAEEVEETHRSVPRFKIAAVLPNAKMSDAGQGTEANTVRLQVNGPVSIRFVNQEANKAKEKKESVAKKPASNGLRFR